MATVDAVYRDGAFHPDHPQELQDGTKVRLTFEQDWKESASTLTGSELLEHISKSWAKFDPTTDRPDVTSENVDTILYGSGGRGGSGDVR